MKYVYLRGGYAAPEGGVYPATVAEKRYRAEHPDYICLRFSAFQDKPMITCHKDVVFDSKGDALLLALQNIDNKIQVRLEELALAQKDLQHLIKARARFFKDYAEIKEATWQD